MAKRTLRKLIVSVQMTTDGLIDVANGNWYKHEGEHEPYGFDQLRAADALLLGRKTYEGLASYWPKAKDEDGPRWADRVNNIPKFVASKTLKGPLEWKARLLEGDMVESVKRLKAEHNLIVYGCGEFAYNLAVAGLVDEVRFWVHPIVVGPGDRPFHGKRVPLHLIASTTFASGVTLLAYRPKPER